MNWKNFIRGLSICTLIFGAVVLFMTLTTSPENGPTTIVVYYLSLLFFLTGITSIIGFLLRRWWVHNEVVFSNVKVSLRQGFLFSALLCAMLILSAMRLLTWWDASIMAVCTILIELYFKTRN